MGALLEHIDFSQSGAFFIALFVAIDVALILYYFLVPKNTNRVTSKDDIENAESAGVKLAMILGNEINAALPSGVSVGKSDDSRIKNLIIRSGNPWNITVTEFHYFKILGAFVGFFFGWGFGAIAGTFITFPFWVGMIFGAVLGYFIPDLQYKQFADRRAEAFTKQLPEILSLLIISTSTGTSFTAAIRECLPYMPDGMVRDEFRQLLISIDSGIPVNDALEEFKNHAPTDGIITFVNSLQEGIELDTPLKEIMQQRAEASREEYHALIRNIIISLPTKQIVSLLVTIMPSLLIILVAPSIASLIGNGF